MICRTTTSQNLLGHNYQGIVIEMVSFLQPSQVWWVCPESISIVELEWPLAIQSSYWFYDDVMLTPTYFHYLPDEIILPCFGTTMCPPCVTIYPKIYIGSTWCFKCEIFSRVDWSTLRSSSSSQSIGMGHSHNDYFPIKEYPWINNSGSHKFHSDYHIPSD